MRRLRLLLPAFALAILGGTYLYAQPANDAAPETPDITVPMEKEAELSPQEMRIRAERHIADMQVVLTHVVELQTAARKQKDVIKLNCVNDKLLQIKQLMNIADDGRTNMTEAIAQSDDPGRYHQYGQITIAKEKVSGLRDEAEACVGEELVFLGPTQVDVDAPTIPDDPTDDPLNPDFGIEQPAYASPYF